jgi:hypothetical protein
LIGAGGTLQNFDHLRYVGERLFNDLAATWGPVLSRFLAAFDEAASVGTAARTETD